MKYQFIDMHCECHPVEKMCQVLEVSRSGYYQWKEKRQVPIINTKRTSIDEAVRRIWSLSKRRYGAPKIQKELIKGGITASRQRVQRRMKLMGIRCTYVRKYRPTTDSKHQLPISENLLERQFNPQRLGEAWISDITYLRHQSGWSYLTTIMDLADRQIIGWSLSGDMSAESTILAAFQMALKKRSPASEMIFHSDRGSQYACKAFRDILGTYCIRQSMSRKANCWDNAVAESFFRIVKTELPETYHHLNREQLRLMIFEYIEIWYNRKRIHSSLGYKTPSEMESLIKQVA
jgi:transposase InsO family protein